MSDRRRIVTLTASGTVTTLLDIESTSILAWRDSFTVTAPPRRPVLSTRQRRYGGARTVQEMHDNGSIQDKVLVKAGSADAAIAVVSTLLKILESPRQDLYFEWRPGGATTSVFYEIRGPATYQATTSTVRLESSSPSVDVDITIPVAPLARLAPQTFTIASTDLPAVTSITGVGGDAPGLADISIRSGQTATAAAPIWALIGWWKKITGATPGAIPPWGRF